MFPKSPLCINSWIILSNFLYLAQSLPETQRQIPYDVFMPPESNVESLPPVVMLHGLMDWRKTWKMVAPEIAKNTGRKVYAYDATNHGENEWSEVFNPSALVSELDQFLQQCNISIATIVGHSMGGETAMHFALNKPQSVEKLIVEDISPRKLSSKVITFLEHEFQALKMGLDLIEWMDELRAKKTLAHLLVGKFKDAAQPVSTDFLIEWLPITKRNDTIAPLANRDFLIKFISPEAVEKWNPLFSGVFDGDALFIYGSNSIFDVGNDELIKKFFPQAKLVGIEGATHLVHFMFGQEFVREVSNFINEKEVKE